MQRPVHFLCFAADMHCNIPLTNRLEAECAVATVVTIAVPFDELLSMPFIVG
jgi:hypothetical protein